MQVRVRQVPSLLGGLAVVLAASVVVAVIVEWGAEQLTWTGRLWLGSGGTAVVALLLGLVVDRRGASIPLALTALLLLGAIAVLFLWLGAWQGTG